MGQLNHPSGHLSTDVVSYGELLQSCSLIDLVYSATNPVRFAVVLLP